MVWARPVDFPYGYFIHRGSILAKGSFASPKLASTLSPGLGAWLCLWPRTKLWLFWAMGRQLHDRTFLRAVLSY